MRSFNVPLLTIIVIKQKLIADLFLPSYFYFNYSFLGTSTVG
jgi:hypothetical protein